MTSTYTADTKTSKPLSKQEIDEFRARYASLQEEINLLNETTKHCCFENLHFLLANKHQEIFELVRKFHKAYRQQEVLAPKVRFELKEPVLKNLGRVSSRPTLPHHHPTPPSEEWEWGDEGPVLRR